jgi:hypothetical protein
MMTTNWNIEINRFCWIDLKHELICWYLLILWFRILECHEFLKNQMKER